MKLVYKQRSNPEIQGWKSINTHRAINVMKTTQTKPCLHPRAILYLDKQTKPIPDWKTKVHIATNGILRVVFNAEIEISSIQLWDLGDCRARRWWAPWSGSCLDAIPLSAPIYGCEHSMQGLTTPHQESQTPFYCATSTAYMYKRSKTFHRQNTGSRLRLQKYHINIIQEVLSIWNIKRE